MIFLTRYGNPYDKRSLQGTFNRYYRKIGVPCRGFHTYRHTFATELVEAGAPIEVVSKLLGHSNINVTAKYYVSISEQTKAQAIHNLAALHQAREAFRIY
ncbi:tyrosine-type recombinase/integrase [Eubacterium pyruvativorans]|nr:tyrosine-type recombinase/integrase [Eubacterium pyruvativorans]